MGKELSSGNPDFQMIITNHLKRYPTMQLEDLYKLTHQACLGSEHAVPDKTSAQVWLEKELADLGDGPDDPLLDGISPDERILRVHLRPFIAKGGNMAKLLAAFIRTANEFHGDLARMKFYGKILEKMAIEGQLPFKVVDIQSFWRQMETKSYPAVHHSTIYQTNYRPAYRVVAEEFLLEMLKLDKKTDDNSPKRD
jgi:hypothetical protein